MSVAISKFITELALHFPPKHARPELETAWLKSMAEALRGTSASVLEDAARRIIQTRKYTSFPLPAECRAACADAADRQRTRADASALPGFACGRSEGDGWTTERLKLAYDLIKTQLGKQAAKEDWILAMWHFCRKQQRLPAGHEIDRCKKEAREFDEAYTEALRGIGPCSQAVVKLGDSMLAKRKELAEGIGINRT